MVLTNPLRRSRTNGPSPKCPTYLSLSIDSRGWPTFGFPQLRLPSPSGFRRVGGANAGLPIANQSRVLGRDFHVVGSSRSTPLHLQSPTFRQIRAVQVSPALPSMTKVWNCLCHPSGPSQMSGANLVAEESHRSIWLKMSQTLILRQSCCDETLQVAEKLVVIAIFRLGSNLFGLLVVQGGQEFGETLTPL
jgi:hypothetical protein